MIAKVAIKSPRGAFAVVVVVVLFVWRQPVCAQSTREGEREGGRERGREALDHEEGARVRMCLVKRQARGRRTDADGG